MERELSQTEIKEFLRVSGLDVDLLDGKDESLEAWEQECNRLVKGFFRYIEDRFTSIEDRLRRLEREKVWTSEGMNL